MLDPVGRWVQDKWHNPSPIVIEDSLQDGRYHRGWRIPFQELIERTVRLIFECDEVRTSVRQHYHLHTCRHRHYSLAHSLTGFSAVPSFSSALLPAQLFQYFDFMQTDAMRDAGIAGLLIFGIGMDGTCPAVGVGVLVGRLMRASWCGCGCGCA